jgi:hypothetical protein
MSRSRQTRKSADLQDFWRYADERTRTSTWSPRHGPEPCASTNSATSANEREAKIAHASRGFWAAGDHRRVRADGGALPAPAPGALLASTCRERAAIVQGTRTPPSHGGNPGSNPGSGTSHRGDERSVKMAYRAKTRTSTGLPAADPTMSPAQYAGCLIQLARTRLTQWPLLTVTSPLAPPLCLRLAL